MLNALRRCHVMPCKPLKTCRATTTENPDGTQSTGVRPYLMDLGSTNGSFINNERVEPQRFYELMEKARRPSHTQFMTIQECKEIGKKCADESGSLF